MEEEDLGIDWVGELRMIVCAAIAQSSTCDLSVPQARRFERSCELWDTDAGAFVAQCGHALEDSILSHLLDHFASTHPVAIHSSRILFLRSQAAQGRTHLPPSLYSTIYVFSQRRSPPMLRYRPPLEIGASARPRSFSLKVRYSLVRNEYFGLPSNVVRILQRGGCAGA